MYPNVLRAAVLLGLVAFPAMPVSVQAAQQRDDTRHVLLISVDGLHQSDLDQFGSRYPHSTMAQLVRGGTMYSNASASTPSDSFPGLLAMITGGTPKTTGVFYDDAYDRTLWKPGSNCIGPQGTETLYAENLDKTLPNGDIPLLSAVIDPKNLPMGMVNGTCQVIYPHQFLKTNTIFSVAHNNHLYTAWSDKHPAYEIINGPSGNGVDDLFTPEINNVNDPTTISVAATDAYDQLKVQAVLNEIEGMTSDRAKPAPVPTIFGMNFQSVSVGQKLVDPIKSCDVNKGASPPCDPKYLPGGYQPGSLKFTPQMTQAMKYVDGALKTMVDDLDEQGLWQSTKIIISAKHGQSPIDPSKLQKVGDPITPVLTAAGAPIAQMTTDDIALIWLKDQSTTDAAVTALNAHKSDLKIDYILSGAELAARFGDPHKNARTPDIIIQPVVGTIYTTSTKKVAEHGGFSIDDTHVALIVSGGSADQGRTVADKVQTTQIAPTILSYLGLRPNALRSVVLEDTDQLP